MKDKVIFIYAAEDVSSVLFRKNKSRDSVDVLTKKIFPPLGILYIASILKKSKIDVNILDMTTMFCSQDDIVEIIAKESPKIIAFSVQSTNLHNIFSLIKKIRINPKLKKSVIVLGGVHLTYVPKSLITLQADYGIVGEGEYSFNFLVRDILNDRCPSEDLYGLVRRENNDVKVNNPLIIKDLDNLPFPAREFWPYSCFSPLLTGKTTSLITSRGCPYNCIFCGLPDKGSFRARSPENVVDEFEYLYKNGYRCIEIQDDFFTYDFCRVEKICSQLIKRNIKLNWSCVTRIDYVDLSLFKLMKKAGCTYVKYGIECASEKVRNDIIKKHITDEEIKRGIEITKKAGLGVVGYFIIGLPGQDLGEIKSTIYMSRKLGLDYIDFFLPIILPGSQLYNLLLSKGEIKNNFWEEVAWGYKFPIYIYEGIKIEKMQRLMKKAILGFYFSPTFIIKELIYRTKNFQNFINKIKLLNSIFKSLLMNITLN